MKTRLITLATVIIILAIFNSTILDRPSVDAQSSHPPPTSNIEVKDGAQPGHSVVSWNVVPDATYYRIGYINYLDYSALLLANPNANWSQTVIFTELAAKDLIRSNDRTEFTIQHLEPGVQHFFSVLTSKDARWDADTVSGAFVWPTNPPWTHHTAPEEPAPPPDNTAPTPAATPTPTTQPTPAPQPTPTPAARQ